MFNGYFKFFFFNFLTHIMQVMAIANSEEPDQYDYHFCFYLILYLLAAVVEWLEQVAYGEEGPKKVVSSYPVFAI